MNKDQEIFFGLIRAAIWADDLRNYGNSEIRKFGNSETTSETRKFGSSEVRNSQAQPSSEVPKFRSSGSSQDDSLASSEVPKFRDSVSSRIPDAYDWTNVFAMLKEQALMGLVASVIMQLPKEKSPQTLELQDALLSSYAMHIRTRDEIQRTIVTVFTELENHGIKPMLMKGESMVRFYPKTAMRGIGDVDILVPTAQYHEAVKLLQKLSGDPGHEDSMERHYKILYNGFDLEIHQRPIWCANSTHKKDFQRLSMPYADPDRAEIITLRGKSIRVFPMEYNLIFIFNHLLEHLRDGGVGFKQIVDWTVMLGNREIRKDGNSEIRKFGSSELRKLREDLKRCGLFRAWRVMGGIAVKQFGLPREMFPFYDERLAEKSQGEILRRIMEGGIFGWKLHTATNESRPAPLRILGNMVYVVKDTRYLWTLFPAGALASSWGIIMNSLRNHAGIVKGNRVFDE